VPARHHDRQPIDIADRGTITGPFIPAKSDQSRLIGGYRDLRGRCTTDCLVTTITVTLCGRMDSTDLRYPPICVITESLRVHR